MNATQTTPTLRSYLQDEWVSGGGEGAPLHDPTTGDVVARVSTEGLDLASALRHAREAGGAPLRAMTFAERGELLAGLSKAVHGGREELIALSTANTGTTRGDGKFDVDGATATLMAYAEIGKQLGDRTTLKDGELEALGRSPRFSGGHIKVPLRGVAVHINAFNFPCWGLAEKLACAFLAGMPVLTKPATATAWPTVRMGELMVESGLLPAGAWSLLGGSARDLLDHLDSQDVIAFTGSAQTGCVIRGHENVIRRSIRVNVEADSLNAMVVGPDVEAGSDACKLFLNELAREMTQKSGQKCTATRRVFLPEALVEPVVEGLRERLADIRMGPPQEDGVRMGSLATPGQFPDVCDGIRRLAGELEIVLGEMPGDGQEGAFVAPIVFLCRDPMGNDTMHDLEVFGPVVTIGTYSGDAAEAARLVARGGGSLVSSVYSDDLEFLRTMLYEIAPYNGRVLLGGKRILEYSTGPGLVLPNLMHGGPGRAGGGSELGGERGLGLYLQTVAVQGPRPILERIL